MTSKGRKPNTQPALAWDKRRALLLVQVLASNDPYQGIGVLCDAWGVEWSQGGMMETIRALAKHALEHGRDEGT